MKKPEEKFKRKAVKAMAWSKRNKLAATACIAFCGAGAAMAGWSVNRHFNDAVTDVAARDREWTTVQADIDALAAVEKPFIAAYEMKKNMEWRPLPAGVTPEQLKNDVERLGPLYSAASNKLKNDFAFAKDLSLSDIDTLRDRMNTEFRYEGVEGGFRNSPSARSIRKCAEYVMSRPGFDRSFQQEVDVVNCASTEQDANGALYFMMGGFLIALTLNAVTGARSAWKNWPREVEAEDRRIEAERRAAEQAALRDSIAESEQPMALAAPTKISRPLKLKLKL